MSVEMKDSGIDWIGDIPKHWEIIEIRKLFNRRSEKNNPVKTKERLSLSIDKGVTLYSEKTTNLDRFKEDFTQYQLAYPDDIVLNSMNMIVGAVGKSNYWGCVSPVYYVIYRKNIENNIDFYSYMLNTPSIREIYHKLGQGIYAIERGEGRVNTCRLKVDYYDFGKICIPHPPVAEQSLIANFLDKKCAEIDELIALQEQMIAQLTTYKQAVITETVTKGLDPNVKMKDSGVEWIGEIPEHWDVCRLKYLTNGNLQYGANESGVTYDANLPRYVRITDILDNTLREDITKLSLTEEQAKDYILQNNDLLFARSGATVGKAFIYDELYGRCAFAGYLIRASINNENSAKFVYYYTQTSMYEEWKKQVFVQATIQNIGADKYAQLPIVTPSLSEQQSIANYLDQKCKEIDELISVKKEKIEKLKAYKKSVIYEYVTGKKQVN